MVVGGIATGGEGVRLGGLGIGVFGVVDFVFFVLGLGWFKRGRVVVVGVAALDGLLDGD